MLNFRKTHNPTTLQCADRPRAGLWAAPHRRPGQPASLEVPPSATRSRGPSEAVPLAVRRSAVLRRQRHACLEHVAAVAERALAAVGRISAAVAAVRRFPCSGAVRPAARPGGPLRRRMCLRVAVVQPSPSDNAAVLASCRRPVLQSCRRSPVCDSTIDCRRTSPSYRRISDDRQSHAT